jgi:hypothetical protein
MSNQAIYPFFQFREFDEGRDSAFLGSGKPFRPISASSGSRKSKREHISSFIA